MVLGDPVLLASSSVGHIVAFVLHRLSSFVGSRSHLEDDDFGDAGKGEGRGGRRPVSGSADRSRERASDLGGVTDRKSRHPTSASTTCILFVFLQDYLPVNLQQYQNLVLVSGNVSELRRIAVATRSEMAVQLGKRRDASCQTNETFEVVQDGAVCLGHRRSRSSCMASG